MSAPGKILPLLLLPTLACDCDGGSVTAPTTLISAEPRVLDFGRVYLGTEARRVVNVGAIGTASLRYQAQFGPEAEGFLAGPANAQIAAGGSLELEILFRPTRARQAKTQLILEHDGENEPRLLMIELLALGVEVPDCEDGNACTLDEFDLEAERCVHEAAPLACNDLDHCTTADTCVEGICLGTSVNCDDANPCTDDFCDPAEGCVHLPTSNCDDGNPCTADICSPNGGCEPIDLPDGTPCDDGEQCTSADVCFSGDCIGVSVPDGSPCDDFDPCSKNDQCTAGICLDPTYHRPLPGELKFATPIVGLVPGASENPILDRDNSVYVGVLDGVLAIDECGAPLWENRSIGEPRFGAAVATPGTLIVPVGSRIHRIRARDGAVLSSVDLAPLFPPLVPPIATASTSTSVTIVDVAVRSSGTLVASVLRRITNPNSPVRHEGILAEVDAEDRSSVFENLGSRHARRLGIDRDEAIVAILVDGELDSTSALHRLVRFGVTGASSSWSTSATTAVHTELALGFDGVSFWTHGLVRVDRDGIATRLRPPRRDATAAGSPVASGDLVFVLERAEGAESLPGDELVCLDPNGETVYRTAIGGFAPRMSPAVDAVGRVYVVGSDAVLRAYDADGRPVLATGLDPGAVPNANLGAGSGFPLSRVSTAIAFSGTIVVVADGHVFGVAGITPPAAAPWPRHRRDNLSTGHR